MLKNIGISSSLQPLKIYHKEAYVSIIFQSFLGNGFLQLLLNMQPDSVSRTGVSGSRTGVNSGCYLSKSRQCVIEEPLIALAEIAFPAAAVVVQTESIFHTTAAADVKVFAEEAFVGKILLGAGKGAFFTACSEFL